MPSIVTFISNDETDDAEPNCLEDSLPFGCQDTKENTLNGLDGPLSLFLYSSLITSEPLYYPFIMSEGQENERDEVVRREYWVPVTSRSECDGLSSTCYK